MPKHRLSSASSTPSVCPKVHTRSWARANFCSKGYSFCTVPAAKILAEGNLVKEDMNQFVVRVQAAPKGSEFGVGVEIGRFETEEEAEYFLSFAVNLRAFHQCDLVVAKLRAAPRMAYRADATW